MGKQLVGDRFNPYTKEFTPVYEERQRSVQTITKTKIGFYEVMIWSSRLESDRALSCFMGPDAELIELVDREYGTSMDEAIEVLRDRLEGVARVTAYAVTDANGNGALIELR